MFALCYLEFGWLTRVHHLHLISLARYVEEYWKKGELVVTPSVDKKLDEYLFFRSWWALAMGNIVSWFAEKSWKIILFE